MRRRNKNENSPILWGPVCGTSSFLSLPCIGNPSRSCQESMVIKISAYHWHMSLNSRRDMCRGSWDALGPLWDMCRGGLGPSWGSFGDALAPPWEHLEALLGRLQVSWDMCRAPRGPPGPCHRKTVEGNQFFGPILGPKMETNLAS